MKHAFDMALTLLTCVGIGAVCEHAYQNPSDERTS